jgi:hypothetical protein
VGNSHSSRRRVSSRIGGDDHDDEFDYEERAEVYARVMREIYGAQRAVLRRLRDEGRITDEVRRAVEQDLDLEEARLDGST